MKKLSLDQQAKQGSLKGEKAPEVQYRCSKTGSFEVICQAGSCHCLNATSGDPVGSAIRGALESVDCTETQMKTKPKSVKVRLTVAKDKKLADFSAQARQEIIDKIKREMEKKAPGSNVTVVLRDGSILADVTVESTGQSDVEGVDINSAAESFIAEANINGIELTVGGETFSTETGTASLTEIVVENPVTERPSERDDNDDKNRRNRIIIIVVVVVGGSALIAIGIGIYCYKKANKSKNMQPFSDIQGKNNPVYNNEVQN
ncbi:hypothetical protein DPMN_150712 [Dreissena polymorpha]|uniref:Uncharacterized protein n=2 Tax=Dreissena polymorpha TaxID=45954 RepID=A0A9D4J6K9_DREPO|nr:hypothetical protein DPMN_150712 [Dreissena polymorpha]